LLKGFELKPEDDLDSRKPMVNKDCTRLAAPRQIIAQLFLKNADADEMIFIHKEKENYAP
jgi:homogentisate 1,2-dioxygenase